MAAGLAAFVQGYYGARDRQRNIANEKEDRARQKKLDELVFAREGRAQEEHDLRMAEARRAISDREAERGAFSEAYGATQDAMAADAAPAAGAGGGPGGAPVDPVQGVAAELGLPLGAVTNRASDAYVAANPLPSTPAVARPGPTVAAAAELPPPAAPPTQPMGAVPPDNRGILPGAELQRFGPSDRGSGMIAQELYDMGAIGRRYTGGTPPAAPARDIGTASDAVARAAANDPTLPRALREDMASRAGVPSPFAAPEGTPGAGPRVSALPPAEQKADKQARTAVAAMGAVEETASPEVQGAIKASVAAAAAPAAGKASGAVSGGKPGAKGLKPGEAVTPAQRERASKAFIDYYAEVGAPKVIEAYLKRGEIDKAMAFQTFMDSQTTKAGMKDWALATFALTTGDIDGFADRLMDSYNRNSYISDDTIVLKDESEIFKDSAGNVTGARIVFKDQKSGNTFDQVFSGPEDLIAFGMMSFDPANVFQMYQDRIEAAKSGAKGALDTAKTAAEIDKLQAEAEKARADAASTRAISGLGAVAGVPDTGVSGGPPVAYRP